MSDVLNAIRDFVHNTAILSTHEHHREEDFHRNLDLDGLFAASYVGWLSLPKGRTPQERQEWLEKVRYNSYFVWLDKAVQMIYGTDPITELNWDETARRIRDAHQQPGHHTQVLKQHGRYIRFLQDCYWNSGSDVGIPEMATPVYRVDLWMNAFTPEIVQQNISAAWTGKVNSLDGFEEALTTEIKSRRSGIAALKCAIAYERSLDFQPVDRSEIFAIYGKPASLLTENDKKKFGDYVMGFAAQLAAGLDLPIQIHTGLARLSGSNPLLLEPIIARFPATRFVLFHGGFPWVKETAAITHNYGNVVLDINWLPLISTTTAIEALHTYIEVLPDSGHITWGGDCWTSEESVGASLAFRNVLCTVLSQKVEQGYFHERQAFAFAEKIMHRNAKQIYSL